MESKLVKELNDRRQIIADSKREHVAQRIENLSEVSKKEVLPRSRMLGKWKRIDGCESNCGADFRKSLPKNYSNFMKSGLPQRILFYENNEWKDFPKDTVELAREEFKVKNTAIVVQSDGCHFMLDILYMIQVDLKTASQKPIAWIDDGGGCYFPQLHSTAAEMYEHRRSQLEKDEEFVGMGPDVNREIKLHLQIEVNGVNSGFEECVEESNTGAKRIKLRPNDLELGANEDYYNDKHVNKAEQVVDKVQKTITNPPCQIGYLFETVDIECVKKMFFEGMKPSSGVNIFEINKCSTHMTQTRWEMFKKQAELTQKYRGDPNIRYAWFAATKDVLSSTLTYGIAHCGSKHNATYGVGVHLTSVKCAITSANYCDVDGNGVQHIVFCRVIMGNVELVRPGSTQFHPSSERFDNGVNDLENPSHYIVWNMNMNTHIYPEYVVSFKMPHNDKAASLKGKEHNGVPDVNICRDHPRLGMMGSPVVKSENNQNSSSSNPRTTNLPCIPFTTLFDAIAPKVSQDEMKKLYDDYEEYKNKKVSRQQLIMKLRLIVGDEELKRLMAGVRSKVPGKSEV